jgi:hypothetical protein
MLMYPTMLLCFNAASSTAARLERTTLLLVGVMDHVEGGGSAGGRDAGDFLALWRVMYALLAGSRAGG